MIARRSAATLAGVVFTFALLAPAVAARAETSGKIQKKQETALAAAQEELLKLARACAQLKAFVEARAELARGLELVAGAKKLEDELKKLEGKEGTASGAVATKLDAERAKAHEKCASLVAEVAALADKEKDQDAFDRSVALIQRHFPSEKAYQKLGLVWFAPYQQWTRKADAQKLEQGGELIDGKWLDARAMDLENAKHAKDPWVVGDEVHEVKTTLPYRTARSILAHVALYRSWFLARFQGEWDLRAPEGKLPVIVTGTQAELREQLRAAAPGQPVERVNGAAYYLQTNGTLNPCFVTFEPTDVTGKTFKIGLDKVLIPLRHEVTHQLACEYSKHDFDRSRLAEHHFWSIEGLATFLQAYQVDRFGRWKVTHPKLIAMGEGHVEGDFAWTQAHLDSIPPLEKFMKIPREKFMTVENYHIAATVSYFLLEGEGRKYRSAFVKVLEAVHRSKESADTFEQAFAGVDLKAMQRQFEQFVRRLKLDPS